MKKEESIRCLSEYYDMHRPDYDSLYIVISSVIMLEVNKADTKGIVLNPEYIFYCEEQKKVRLSRAENYKKSYERQLEELLIYLEKMSEYAGEYTYAFVKAVRKAYCEKGVKECCKVIKQYENKRNPKEVIAFAVFVLLFQIFYYMLTKLRFYI